jgi:riboflavin synthase alpha subunit
MFTGLMATTGTLAARSPRGPGARLTLEAWFEEGALGLGESIAVDGSSVTAIRPEGFEVNASQSVNLEVDLVARCVARLLSPQI